MPTPDQLEEMERALNRGKSLSGVFFKLVFGTDVIQFKDRKGFESHSEKSQKADRGYYIEVQWFYLQLAKIRKSEADYKVVVETESGKLEIDETTIEGETVPLTSRIEAIRIADHINKNYKEKTNYKAYVEVINDDGNKT